MQGIFLCSEFEQLLWKKCGTKDPAISTARILKRWLRDRGLWRKGEMDVLSFQRGKARGLRGDLIDV